MNTLTSAISIPNIQKMRVRAYVRDLDASIATISVEVQGSGSRVYPQVGSIYTLQVANGSSTGIRATVSPTTFTDQVEIFTTTTASGFTDIEAAFTGTSGNTATKLRAVETALISAGLMPAGTVA